MTLTERHAGSASAGDGWLFSRQPRAAWVWVMAIVTGTYLLVECGFNSRLLDVVGGMPDKHAVEAIEVRGRLISGAAVALVLWPFLLRRGVHRGWHPLRTAAALLAISVPAIALTYHAERELVDAIVERSSPEQRYLAVNLLTVQNALVAGGVELANLPLTREQLAAPDGKTFLAVFPLLAYSTRNLEEKIREQKAHMLRSVTDRAYGGLDKNYNRFLASREELIKRYNEDYLVGCDKYNAALSGIGARQQRAWRDYTARLARRGLSPERVPPAYWRRVRDDVRANGVPVPKGWDPGDRGAFDDAIERKVRTSAMEEFHAAVARHFDGQRLAPNLDKRGFFSHPLVQDDWRRKLQYADTGVRLPIDLPSDREAPRFFERAVYEKVLDWHVQDKLKKHSAPVATFADDGRHQELGMDSMRAMVVPPVALAFSIMGALVHLIKLALFVVQLAFGRGFTYGLAKGAFVTGSSLALLGVFHFVPTSQIPHQPLYDYFEQRGAMLGGEGTPTLGGRAMVFYARSVIQVQPVAYPLFEAVRVHVLRGHDFGYRPTTIADDSHD
ncbi:hypothetical protein [Massilia arenae]|uniref:Uncharacterized protein n=1 Tax=Massilia arenae TaxID=2603288 RepID=A0A5C7G7C2_9BURK|nr:hypothetical protein [Massilia arenae]TXG01939.1 hypothetical protein FVD38_01800 [Massilia arenae]